ncbi:hypothetical protein SteCoe_20156 [Stentor coeruleus]|uniref:Uncharacterized protein n=1 Tax=Stentor coeruleus TaxID=5963 RepID=A0A1R2BSP5_9CILI|nr:hypothetical protein SteCoe_20156 [Stentor coeruleus]
MLTKFDNFENADDNPSSLPRTFDEVDTSQIDPGLLSASKSELAVLSTSGSYKKSLANTVKRSVKSSGEKSLSVADLTNTDTFAISKTSIELTEEEMKNSKPPLSFSKILKTKVHCKTCKCKEISPINSKTLTESSSLQYLSKLESIPFPENFCKAKIKKPYVSPLFKSPAPPSQIFRQRINSHALQYHSQKTIPTYHNPAIRQVSNFIFSNN